MFQLLSELLEIRGSLLTENLGNLRDLGLGRMVDAFKQQYYEYGKGRNSSLHTSSISPKLNHYSGIGKDSQAVDIGIVSKWAQIKKAFKAHDDMVGAAFSIDGKVVMLIVGSNDNATMARGIIGMAWDFTGVTGLDEEKLKAVLERFPSTLAMARYSRNDRNNVHKDELQSRHVLEKEDYSDKILVHHFEGIGAEARYLQLWFDGGNERPGLFDVVGSRLHLKIITSDKEKFKKEGDRYKNKPISPSEIRLFKDDLKTRLALYKNTKVQTVEDMKEFVDKVFEGKAKKLTIEGYTYFAVPAKKMLGHNNSYKYEKVYRTFMSDDLHNLFSGKPVMLTFEGDSAAHNYKSIYVTIQFKNGQIVPIKASYYKDGKQVEENF